MDNVKKKILNLIKLYSGKDPENLSPEEIQKVLDEMLEYIQHQSRPIRGR